MPDLATGKDSLADLRFAAPQVLTSLRIVLAMLVIVFASRDQAGAAVTILLFGLLTDVLDGACARLFGVVTGFGQLFDFFADYLCFVAAPAVVTLSIAASPGTLMVLLLSLPCVCAALRYARKAGLSETEYPGIPASPGVPTTAYSLYVVALALLEREQALSQAAMGAFLTLGAPLLSVLMIVRTRYPKLSVYPSILVPTLAGLMIMPFAYTVSLATVTLVLIAVYVLAGPGMVPQRPGIEAPPQGVRVEHAAEGRQSA